jgi:hypothetical protein
MHKTAKKTNSLRSHKQVAQQQSRITYLEQQLHVATSEADTLRRIILNMQVCKQSLS